MKLILRGSYSCGSVQEAIWRPKDIVEKINKLWVRAEELDYYDHSENDDEMEKIDDEFYKLIKNL